MHDLCKMSDEELVRLSQGGNPDSTEFLMTKFKPLVLSVAKSYFIAGGEQNDLIQEGMIGLFKAVRDYSNEKNTLFKSFATVCIRRQIIDAIRSSNRLKHNALNSSLSLDDLNEGDVISSINLEAAVFESEEHKNLKENIKNVLSKYEIRILNLYLDNKSYQDIADTVGKDIKSIDNALQRIKKKIRDLIA